MSKETKPLRFPTKAPVTSAESPEPVGEGKVRVLFDDSNLRSAYANVVNVAANRTEFTLLFGTNQTWNKAKPEVTVLLSDRITMNPFAAKRLSEALRSALKQYEDKNGVLRLDLDQGDEKA